MHGDPYGNPGLKDGHQSSQQVAGNDVSVIFSFLSADSLASAFQFNVDGS